jgi:nucleotide-binding universal stress UspA family protein
MFKKILHANDGSEGAFKALSVALEIAQQSKAQLHSVSVEEISQFHETIEDVKEEKGAADRRFRNVTKRAHQLAAARKVPLQMHVLTGHPVVTILDVAEQLDVDLLVIGATGQYSIHERMIGSRADRLVHLASCPVLVVR